MPPSRMAGGPVSRNVSKPDWLAWPATGSCCPTTPPPRAACTLGRAGGGDTSA